VAASAAAASAAAQSSATTGAAPTFPSGPPSALAGTRAGQRRGSVNASFGSSAPSGPGGVSPESAVTQGGARDMDSVLRETLLALTPSARFADAAALREALWTLYCDAPMSTTGGFGPGAGRGVGGAGAGATSGGPPHRLDARALVLDLCTDPRSTSAHALALTGDVHVGHDGRSSPASRRASMDGATGGAGPSLGDASVAGTSLAIAIASPWHARGGTSPAVPGLPRLPGLLKAFLVLRDAESGGVGSLLAAGGTAAALDAPITRRSALLLLAHALGVAAPPALALDEMALCGRIISSQAQTSAAASASSVAAAVSGLKSDRVTLRWLLSAAERGAALGGGSGSRAGGTSAAVLDWLQTCPFGACSAGNPCDAVPLHL
jgi:hypothetical protein